MDSEFYQEEGEKCWRFLLAVLIGWIIGVSLGIIALRLGLIHWIASFLID